MDAVVMVVFALIVSCGLGFGGLVRLLFCALFVVVGGWGGSCAFLIAILWGLFGVSLGLIWLGGRVVHLVCFRGLLGLVLSFWFLGVLLLGVNRVLSIF